MLIDDVQLLLSNARSFNGDNCEISSCAEKLVSQLVNALNHEKTHFGIQGDVINVLEEAIKKKYELYFCCISLCTCFCVFIYYKLSYTQSVLILLRVNMSIILFNYLIIQWLTFVTQLYKSLSKLEYTFSQIGLFILSEHLFHSEA
jgi:hypothetical protein